MRCAIRCNPCHDLLTALRCEWLERLRRGDPLNAPVTSRRRARDSDDDGIPDAQDNCPESANPAQDDFDLDGIVDACDRDDDNDHDPDRTDPAPHNARIFSGSCDDHSIDTLV